MEQVEVNEARRVIEENAGIAGKPPAVQKQIIGERPYLGFGVSDSGLGFRVSGIIGERLEYKECGSRFWEEAQL